MPTPTIRHVTTYRYRQPVAFGEHRMMLRPRDASDQRVLEASIEISPKPGAYASFRTTSAIIWGSPGFRVARKNCPSRALCAWSIRPRTSPASRSRKQNALQPELGRPYYVGRVPQDQAAETDTATKALSPLPGATNSRSAVSHLLKSVVRENRTPRSVGTGGRRPPPVTRCSG